LQDLEREKTQVLPDNMLNEIIELMDKSQKEAKDLTKEKKFYQDEVQNLKNEIANIRLENDKSFARNMQESQATLDMVSALKTENAAMQGYCKLCLMTMKSCWPSCLKMTSN